MKRFVVFASLALVLVFAMSAIASDRTHFKKSKGAEPIAPVSPLKARVDSLLILGPWGEAPYNGQFEDVAGNMSWNGWTTEDATLNTRTMWSVSNFMADELGAAPFIGNLAAWCGYPYIACSNDEEGGYGNSWYEILEWRTTVGDPSQTTTIDWDFYITHDTEAKYDFVYVIYVDAVGDNELAEWDQKATNLHAEFNFSYFGDDYAGDLGDEIVLQIAFLSDVGWSDEDCIYATMGACQVDDITITCTGASNVSYFHDFEDGTFGEFLRLFDPNSVGDFATLRNNLGEIDPCTNNSTWQATFVDDGVVVPGTGGTLGINWRYGPGGFIVTPEGGLAGPDYYIHNGVVSPIMAWGNQSYDGAILNIDVYAHEDLDEDAPGVYYAWNIRSTPSLNSDDMVFSGWRNDDMVWYGDAVYYREYFNVTNLLLADRQFVQVKLSVREYGYVWDYIGTDGYPAPYFDNARLTTYPIEGPAIAGRVLDRAQDVFPAIGTIDYGDLGVNSCRFDMAQSISPQEDMRNDPGDSIIFQVSAVRSASRINGTEIRWILKPNHLFDPYRTSVFGLDTEGFAAGENATGNQYAFDLPDENFLFPGDILHYYIYAEDKVGGSDIGVAIFPVDTTGFSDFSTPLAYYLSFTVNCLPTIVETSPGAYDHPTVLFWNDAMLWWGDNEWYFALNNLGLIQGEVPGGYDTYCTSAPSSGVGNGLSRAGLGSIAAYNTMLYASSSLGSFTICNGDFNGDPGDDVELLDQWMQMGDKNLFMTGDEFVNDMVNVAGPATAAFVATYLGVSVQDFDIRPLINNQYAPLIRTTPVNPVFATVDSWIAYGGCFNYNSFDALTTMGDGYRLAEFTDPSGNMGAYPYSAATLNENATYNSTAITMPMGFLFIYDDPDEFTKANAPMNARTRVLNDVLTYFGEVYGGVVDTDVPAGQKFALSNSPNPFNPKTTINFVMPKTGHLTLKVFNVRGEHVRTLMDGIQQVGPNSVDWDGTNDKGAAMPSGVYFFQGGADGKVLTEKCSLLR